MTRVAVAVVLIALVCATVVALQRRWLPRRPLLTTWAIVGAFYLALAILTIGSHAVAHPRYECACGGGGDPAIFIWALRWWPHAIAHGINPFVTRSLWWPTGVDLARSTMIPTAAILLAPVTLLFGPIFSYNVLAISSPALAAFTAYLLCRRITKR